MDTKLLALVAVQIKCYHLVYLIFYLGTLKLGGLVVVNLSKAVFEINTLRTGSFKLFKRPFPGFLTILTL